jgi:hypothetical protein
MFRAFSPRSLLLAGVVALATVVAAPTAGATTLLTCPGSNTTTYTPGLTNTPTPVAVSTSSSFGPCVNAATLLELRTGSAVASLAPQERSCTDLLSPNQGTRTFSWSTGTTSTFTFDASSSYVAGGAIQIVLTGTITAGEFTGKSAVGTVTNANLDLTACDGSGITQANGLATFTITG